MRWHHRALLGPICWLVLGGLAPAADPDPVAADEQIVKAAHLATDGPALLHYLRQRVLTDKDRTGLEALIRQLGDDSYRVREKASADLVRRGTAAVPFLQRAVKDPDIEVVRRAEECLRLIEKGNGAFVLAAVVRLVAVRKPAGAAEVLLAYLPFAETDAVAEEVHSALTALAGAGGQPDPAILAALADPVPARRAAAAEALCRAGGTGQRPAVRPLLRDPEPAVRLRVGLALAEAKDPDAIPVLIDLLAQLPPAQAWPAEDLLLRLAEDKAPAATLGGDAAARRKCRDTWAAWWAEHGPKVDWAKLEAAPRLLGYTLVVLLDAGRVLELGPDNKPRWQISGVEFPLDAQVLPGDRVLLAEHGGNRVTERNLRGEVVWEKRVEEPLVAQRLPNGNTFIGTRTRLLEVDRSGKEVFAHTLPNGLLLMKGIKLRTGEYACVLHNQRFVRLDATGKEVASFPAAVRTFGGRLDVLPSGRVLIPQMQDNKVVEYDADGKAVWEVPVAQPIAAVRLPNGHTLVTSMTENRAIEFDRNGKEVWEYRSELPETRLSRAFRR